MARWLLGDSLAVMREREADGGMLLREARRGLAFGGLSVWFVVCGEGRVLCVGVVLSGWFCVRVCVVLCAWFYVRVCVCVRGFEYVCVFV